MNRTIRYRRHLITFSALLAFGSGPTFGMEQFSLNFTKVEFEYSPGRDTQIPFAIELTINADGSVDGVLPGRHGHNVTLKRGVIQSAGSAPGALLEMSYSERGSNPSEAGRLRLEAIDAGNLAFDIVQSPQQDDSVAFSLDRDSYGEHIELRFVASEGTVISGRPAALFGPSGTGKTLTANLLAPRAGSTLEMVIEVVDDRGYGTLIPVKVKHNL